MAGTGLMYGSEPRDKFNSAGKKEPIFFLHLQWIAPGFSLI